MSRQYTLKPGRMQIVYDAMPAGEWVSTREIRKRTGVGNDSTNMVTSGLRGLVARGLVVRREDYGGTREWRYLKRPESEAIMLADAPPVMGPKLPVPPSEQGVGYQPEARPFEHVFTPKHPRPARPWVAGAPVGHTIGEVKAGITEGAHRKPTPPTILDTKHGTARCVMLTGCTRPACLKAYKATQEALGLS